jgi:hypothetical protein
MEDAAPPVGLVKFARRALIFSVETGRSVPLKGLSLRIEAMENLKSPREVIANPDQEEEAMASHAILR